MDTQTIVNLFIPFTLMTIMFAMGLGLVVNDFKLVFTQPRAVAIGVLSQLVLLPAVGFLLAWTLAPSPAMAVGLVLVASCPGGPSSNLMTNLAGGDTALSVSLTAISGVVTIISIPLITNFAASIFAVGDVSLTLPVLETVLRILVVVALPLAAGMILHYKSPTTAARIETWVKRAAVLLLAVLIVGALIKSRKDLAGYGFDAVLPPLLLSLAGVLLGAIAAFTLKLTPRQRVAIPIEVGAQNAALAIGLALASMESNDVAFPGVVYGTFMYLPCAAAVFIGRSYLARVSPPAPATS